MYLATMVGDLSWLSVGDVRGASSGGEFLETAGEILVSSIWQGAIVACALAISLGLCLEFRRHIGCDFGLAGFVT